MLKNKDGTHTFIQVGFTSMRSPSGDFLPSVPLYAQVPVSDVDTKTGLYTGEDKALLDVGAVFADKFRQYVEGGGIVPRARKGKYGKAPT